MVDFENQSDEGQEEQVSSEPAEQSEESSPAESASQPKQEASSEREMPFHEHPRFKEIVEQKNQALEQAKQFQRAIDEMQARLKSFESAKQTTKDPLLDRLKGIDPEFGERFESVDKVRSELEEFKQWKSNLEAERIREKAMSQINELHAKNNVPEEFRSRYNRDIEFIASKDPNITLDDLSKVYQQVHEEWSKLLTSVKRDERKTYVEGKKKDASVPASQSKGSKASAQKKESSEIPEGHDPREYLKSKIASRALQAHKANSDI